MKKKTGMKPKAALLSSVLSILLCVTMFAGTTYAWFSEDIKNTQNKIMAGSLDVTLEYYNPDSLIAGNDGFVEVDENTTIFDPDARYEPGYTEVVYLRVTNNGSLALKYQFGISVRGEELGVNKAGEPFKLSDYIMFGAAPTVLGNQSFQALYDSGEEGRAKEIENVSDSAAPISLGYRSKPAVLTKKGEVDYLTIVVWMPTDVGNEANAQPGKEPKIDLSIDLVAVQTQFEDDSFGIGYDKEAGLGVLPSATVQKMNMFELAAVNKLGADGGFLIADLTNMSVAQGTGKLDFAYSFKATEANVEQSPYKEWQADFVVSFDRPILAGTAGLGGEYGTFGWILFDAPINIAAGQEIYLLRDSGLDPNLTYQEVCENVKVFNCGAYNKALANVGATMKVDLRLTNPDNATDYVVVGTYSHTFAAKDLVLPEEPEANVNVLGPTQLNALPDMTGIARPDGSVGSATARLEAAYEYYAKETPAQAAESFYANWKADFVISFNRDVAADEVGLAGQYDAFGSDWIAFTTPEAFAKDETIRMLQYGSAAWSGGDPDSFYLTYEGLVNLMGSTPFRCGVFAGMPSAAGLTATVQLVLFETVEDANGNLVETGGSVVVDTQIYTFGS